MTAPNRSDRTAAAPWRARAFGLEIDLAFPAPGLPPATGRAAGPRTRVELISPERIDDDWPVSGVQRVLEETFGRGNPDRTIDVHPRAGYRLYARHFGLARVSAGGGRVRCSPPGVAPWRWQRFLVGRILPWAAVLRGLEVLHASAVVVDGRAIAVVGPTGAGKTSLAVQMVMRGARFLTDDVLALDEREGEIRAHPGAAIAAIRPAERAAVPRSDWRRVGSVVGTSGKTYMELPRVGEPVRLGAVYFLRTGGTFGQIERPDPRLLLGNTFVLGVRTPERLRRQLDVFSAIARTVPMFHLPIHPGEGSQRVAEVTHVHAQREAAIA